MTTPTGSAASAAATPLHRRERGDGVGHGGKELRELLELAKGDVVWRPFGLPDLNQLKVGILVPSQRALPHVTQTFVERLTRRLRQLESVAATL